MHRVRDGEVSLISELFERHHRRLYQYCWRMTGTRAASEDLVQEVFLRILRHRATFDSNQSFGSWMLSIARNLQHDVWRKHRREQQLPASYEQTASDASSDGPGGPGFSPERRVELGRLRDALDALPVDKRELLVMSRYLGMSHAEIAEATGCGEGVSRTRLHRALDSLRDLYYTSSARKEPAL